MPQPVNDFPFVTLKAHQCVSFNEIQPPAKCEANCDLMQITCARGTGFLLAGRASALCAIQMAHTNKKINKIVVLTPRTSAVTVTEEMQMPSRDVAVEDRRGMKRSWKRYVEETWLNRRLKGTCTLRPAVNLRRDRREGHDGRD